MDRGTSLANPTMFRGQGLIADRAGPRLAPMTFPAPDPGHVTVEVVAGGLNRGDLLQCEGSYPAPPSASDVLGLECSGRVVAVGPGVRRWRAGDQVCALVTAGGLATHCSVPESQCVPVPDGVSLVDAAALPEAFATVWDNLFTRGGLAPGEWLLCHGGASGIGTAAIQLAKAVGAHVIATAGGAEKCTRCVELGADQAVDYTSEDFVAACLAATEDRGVDAVLDIAFGDWLPHNIAASRIEGRLVQIGFMRGRTAAFDVVPFMLKRLTLMGTTLRGRTAAEKSAVMAAVEAHVWPMLARGAVRPVISGRYDVADHASAFAALAGGRTFGKIVVTMP
jgi:putative PIG3 family NAD(P)H quinone oxidoreductase